MSGKRARALRKVAEKTAKDPKQLMWIYRRLKKEYTRGIITM